MDAFLFVCMACKQAKPRNPRLKPGSQKYCSLPQCQRVASNCRHQERLANDDKYRISQDEAKKTWRENNPTYWQDYRKSHPAVVRRNRLLQRLRDFGRRGKGRIGSNEVLQVESKCTRDGDRDSVAVPDEVPSGDYVMKLIHPGSPVYVLAHVDVVAVVTPKGPSTTPSPKTCLQR